MEKQDKLAGRLVWAHDWELGWSQVTAERSWIDPDTGYTCIAYRQWAKWELELYGMVQCARQAHQATMREAYGPSMWRAVRPVFRFGER